MPLIEINVTMNEDEAPEWLPRDLVTRLVEEVGKEAALFAERVNAVREKYETEARKIAGENVIPFIGVGR